MNYVSQQINEPNQLSTGCALSNLIINDQCTNDAQQNKAGMVNLEPLGQSGLLIEWGDYKILIDPYLSDYIEKNIDPAMKRSFAAPISPEDCKDITHVFITHAHPDHADPISLRIIFTNNPNVHLICPSDVCDELGEVIPKCISVSTVKDYKWQNCDGITFRAMPAAHPDIPKNNFEYPDCVGFLVKAHGEKIYISGDTFVFPELVQELRAESPIKFAALPVNGHTFLKAEKNILGNMSTHEAFQLALDCKFEYFLPTHWDMFELNSVSLDEIKFLHELYYSGVNMIIGKRQLIFGRPTISIVIRTLNEERYLPKVLAAICAQKNLFGPPEIIIVDSGSADKTIEIAELFHCKILEISPESFTFGKALNIGFEKAQGEIVVALSGHCVPICDDWLEHLVHPIRSGQSVYTYGRQVGGNETNFAEAQVFAKFYPEYSKTQIADFYCNNANSALLKSTWERNKFDEKLTGLEDMALAKTLIGLGERISYVASSAVVHYHHETTKQVKRRFEREALALRNIDPHLNFSRKDLASCFFRNCYSDIKKILSREQHQFTRIPSIITYRMHQFLGVYAGNHMSLEPSKEHKRSYFYGDS